MCWLKNSLRIIMATWQHLCIISNSAESKTVRKPKKYIELESCPASSPPGHSSPGKAEESPSVLLLPGVTTAHDKSSVGELWAPEETSRDVLHQRNWNNCIRPCHVIKEEKRGASSLKDTMHYILVLSWRRVGVAILGGGGEGLV